MEITSSSPVSFDYKNTWSLWAGSWCHIQSGINFHWFRWGGLLVVFIRKSMMVGKIKMVNSRALRWNLSSSRYRNFPRVVVYTLQNEETDTVESPLFEKSVQRQTKFTSTIVCLQHHERDEVEGARRKARRHDGLDVMSKNQGGVEREGRSEML